MSILPKFRFSDTAKLAEEKVPFALVGAKGTTATNLKSTVEASRAAFLQRMKDSLPTIQSNIGHFDAFFALKGFQCPLPSQLRNAEKKGFPTITPFVDALLMCELTNGVLMGIQDLDAIDGELVYDLLTSPESFEGLRGEVKCRPGELVLRDDKAIVASYFQGPDRRTGVNPATTSVLFYVFSAPGLPHDAFDKAIQTAVDLVSTVTTEVETKTFTLE